MEEIVCERSQFDIPHGSLSCTAAAVTCARLSLDKVLDRDDLLRVLQAGAKLYYSWRSSGTNFQLQHWRNVTDTFPAILEGCSVCGEYSGKIHVDDDISCSLRSALRKLEPNTSGVITSDNGSYALCHRDGMFYVFDPHGVGAGATYRRTKDPTLFLQAVEQLCTSTYSMVQFRTNNCTSDTCNDA